MNVVATSATHVLLPSKRDTILVPCATTVQPTIYNRSPKQAATAHPQWPKDPLSSQEGWLLWIDEVGKLKKHLNRMPSNETRLEGCGFTDVLCQYCKKFILRKDIPTHETKTCAKKPYTCQYCGHFSSMTSKRTTGPSAPSSLSPVHMRVGRNPNVKAWCFMRSKNVC